MQGICCPLHQCPPVKDSMVLIRRGQSCSRMSTPDSAPHDVTLPVRCTALGGRQRDSWGRDQPSVTSRLQGVCMMRVANKAFCRKRGECRDVLVCPCLLWPLFSDRNMQVFQREPGEDPLVPPARINTFSLGCNADQEVDATSEAGTRAELVRTSC